MVREGCWSSCRSEIDFRGVGGVQAGVGVRMAMSLVWLHPLLW